MTCVATDYDGTDPYDVPYSYLSARMRGTAMGGTGDRDVDNKGSGDNLYI